MYQIDIFTFFYFVSSELYLFGNICLRRGSEKELEKVMLKNYEKGWGDLTKTLHKIRKLPLTLEGV